MNKGIARSQGEAIIFMNSGDYFYDKDVVSKIAKKFKSSPAEIIYGDAYISKSTRCGKETG